MKAQKSKLSSKVRGRRSKRSSVETTPGKEWSQIVRDTYGDSDKLFKLGKLWLKKNKDSSVAGEVLAKLIEIKAEPKLVTLAKAWLEQFPKNRSRLPLIGAVLRAAPSRDVEKLAIESMKGCVELFLLNSIIRASFENPSYKSLYRQIEELLEKNPKYHSWNYMLISKSTDRTTRAGKLTARWLQLNVDDPKIFVLPHTMLATSPEVIEAAYEWLGRGGQTNEYMATSIGALIRCAAEYHKSFLRKILNFARTWLRINHDNRECGIIYGEMIWATRTKADYGKARLWHKQHRSNESAWFVLSKLLEIACAEQKRPGAYELEQARVFLRDPANRMEKPRLIGSLLDVLVDAETTAWAREKYERTGGLWMLSKLLMHAPNKRLVTEGERTMEQWRGTRDEAKILYGLLKSGYKSALAIRCARVWVRENPKHRHCKAIAAMLPGTGKKSRLASIPTV